MECIFETFYAYYSNQQSRRGIFRILPGEKDTPAYDTYFETVQQRSARQICRDHGIGYRKATSTLGLKWKLKRFFIAQSPPTLRNYNTEKIE